MRPKVFSPSLSKALIFIAIFAALTLPMWKTKAPASANDFVAYWSAAVRLIHRQNPYASEPVLNLEKEVGFTGSAPLIVRNPPWIAPVIAPLGFFSFAVAQRLWLIGAFLATLLSLKWLWELYRATGQSVLATSFVIATFSPIAVALTVGQISPMILLGMAGFLRFEKKGAGGLAGVFLGLAALKPHLMFLLWVALFLWSIYKRSARILATVTFTIALASCVAVLFDPSIFSEYVDFMRREGVVHELTPTLGGALRLSLHSYFLELVPPTVALGWVLFYAWPKIRKSEWKWTEQTPLLVLVSLLATPYAWFFDQVLLLPCVFQAITRLKNARHSLIKYGVAGLYLGANALVMALILFHCGGFWYAWTLPFWFILFTVVSLPQTREPAKAPAGARET